MRILLVSNYQPERAHSMLRYAEMLERALRRRGHDAVIVHPPVVLGRLPFLRGGAAKWIGYLDKYLIARPLLRWKARGADIVHVCDHCNSMYLSSFGRKPQVITLHDLMAVMAALGRYPGIQIGRTGRILQKWISSGLFRARNIICVSHKTEADLFELAPSFRGSSCVIHNPLNWDFSPDSENTISATLSSFGIEPGTQYIFHVGGNSVFKNRPGVIRIFSELRQSPVFRDIKLILAGQPWTPDMHETVRQLGLTGAVIELVKVDNAQLRAFYSGAAALLFPSLEEGFGWPILEAQACGCPVITSNRAPLTEVAGDAAILVDPENPQQAAKAILEGWPNLERLRDAGYRNTERFRLEATIDRYCQVYESVIAASRG